jgi:hypothetical protein
MRQKFFWFVGFLTVVTLIDEDVVSVCEKPLTDFVHFVGKLLVIDFEFRLNVNINVPPIF